MTDQTRLALRPREVARILGRRPETVREMCRRGELPAREVPAGSGRFLIAASALDAWLRGER